MLPTTFSRKQIILAAIIFILTTAGIAAGMILTSRPQNPAAAAHTSSSGRQTASPPPPRLPTGYPAHRTSPDNHANCDINGDNLCTSADAAFLQVKIASQDNLGDFNRSGKANALDFGDFLAACRCALASP